jgi:hypothetical protein
MDKPDDFECYKPSSEFFILYMCSTVCELKIGRETANISIFRIVYPNLSTF